jgi:hypothetical protein
LPAVCITVPAGALAMGGHSASLTRRDRGANMLLGLVAAGPMLEAAVTFQVLERWAGPPGPLWVRNSDVALRRIAKSIA